MVVICVDELRKRAEHNEGRLDDLEELSLHQLHVKKIENLDKLCRNLKILYLQDNSIQKLENLKRLKKLEYLNVSMNAIEKIEGLSSCESLRKLDLTLNYIGEISSIEHLRDNEALEQLFLIGNPCSQFKFYKSFVIHLLPQLKELDGLQIERSDRILAAQNWEQIKFITQKEEENFKAERSKEREEYLAEKEERCNKKEIEDPIERRKDYFQETSKYTPESKLELQNVLEEIEKEKEEGRGDRVQKENEKPERQLFMKDGRPFNINQPKLKFTLDEKRDEYLMNIELYKHLPTEKLDLDIQTNYIRLYVVNKLFQIRLEEDICPDECKADRSKTTGYLLLTLKKVNPSNIILPTNIKNSNNDNEKKKEDKSVDDNYLEVSGVDKDLDFGNICDTSELLDDDDPPALEPL